MRTVDHHDRPLPLFPQSLSRSLHALGVVIRSFGSAPQDHEAVFVAAGPRDGRQALLRHAHEMVLRGCGAHGVNCHVQRAIGSVLEAHRERQTGCQLSMQLTFRRPRTDGAERDEIGEELG